MTDKDKELVYELEHHEEIKQLIIDFEETMRRSDDRITDLQNRIRRDMKRAVIAEVMLLVALGFCLMLFI